MYIGIYRMLPAGDLSLSGPAVGVPAPVAGEAAGLEPAGAEVKEAESIAVETAPPSDEPGLARYCLISVRLFLITYFIGGKLLAIRSTILLTAFAGGLSFVNSPTSPFVPQYIGLVKSMCFFS